MAKSETIPHKPGTLLGSVPATGASTNSPKLTPDEEAVLKAAGWKPGEPMPNLQGTILGERLTKEREKIRKGAENTEGLTPVPPDTPPIKIPVPTDINELPPEKQQEIYESMDEMAEIKTAVEASRAVAAQEAAETPPPSVAAVPGMAEAWKTAAQAQGVAPGGVIIEDDLDNLPPSVESAPPEAETPPSVAPAGNPAKPAEATLCEKCGHKHGDPIIEPTDTDISIYVQSIIGGQRFVKDYELFASKVLVSFRGLTPTEGELARSTAMVDASETGSMVDFTMRYLEYRMTMSLTRVHRAGHEPVNINPLLDACTIDDAPKRLRELRDWLNHKVYMTEETRQVIADTWSDFSGLMNLLNAKARDPGFFENAVTPDS